ncbi:MAG: hypothetical protein KDL87_18310, partial [Verrucomicrobiae bacterium]|nr:hypothetical protein [Verrucomicrobiae bacterium]
MLVVLSQGQEEKQTSVSGAEAASGPTVPTSGPADTLSAHSVTVAKNDRETLSGGEPVLLAATPVTGPVETFPQGEIRA